MPATDQNGHQLMPMRAYPQAVYLCTSCGTRHMTASEPPCVCQRGCGIALCPKCTAAPGCPRGHALQFSPAPQGWKCDACQRVGQAGQPAHSCRICNYDQCRSCTVGPEESAAGSPGGRIHHHGHGGRPFGRPGGYSHASGCDYSKVQPVFSGAHGRPPMHMFQWLGGAPGPQGMPPAAPTGGMTGGGQVAGYGAFQQQHQQPQQQPALFFTPQPAAVAATPAAVSQQLLGAAAAPASAVQEGAGKRRRFRRHSNHQAPPAVAMEAPKGGRMRSLFIGINYFNSDAQLNGCINDVAVMMGVVQAMGFDITDRRVLVDDSSFPGVTGEPTRAEIIDAMKWLVADARKGDQFFLHYSGHGVQVADSKADKADGGTAETLAPVDFKTAGLLYDREIYDLLCPALPTDCRLTALIDCCHSGDVMNLEFVWQWDDAKRLDGEFVRRQRPDLPGDILVISGCKDEQTSADVSDVTSFQTKFTAGTPGAAGGACTNALAEVVATKMGGDGKCHVSFEELLRMIQESLVRRKFTQVPQLSASCTINLDSEFSLFGALPEDPK